MKRTTSIEHLRGRLLRSVSRSFYLSLRLLPKALRDPISLAYLLARATDTIADTAQIETHLREESLRKLARAIQGELPEDELLELSNRFVPQQKNLAERELIESLPSIQRWLAALGEQDAADVRAVLGKINHGQLLDVQRFGEANGVRALTSAEELDEYAYLVAGCVGEFWTDICFRHIRNFADRTAEEMRTLGRAYGKGLQLINILRDAGADFRNSRCYLPDQELKNCGVLPNELISRRAEMMPVFDKWRQSAEQGIAAGMDYSCAIRPARVRFATALPALIGVRTLALLRAAGADALQRPVKVPRSEVRAIMSSTTMTLASPRALRKKFNRLSQ